MKVRPTPWRTYPEFFPPAMKPPAVKRWEYLQTVQAYKDRVLENLIELNPGDCRAEVLELRWRRQGAGGPFR